MRRLALVTALSLATTLAAVGVAIASAPGPDYLDVMSWTKSVKGSPTARLTATTKAPIPRHPDSFIRSNPVVGIAWVDLQTSKAFVATIHPAIGRDSNQNPRAWHAHTVTLAGGAIFGLVRGSLYVFVAATLGSMLAFLVCRHLARGFIEQKIAGNERFAKIDRAIAREGRKIVFLLRLSPAFPFTLLNYALGLTRVSFLDYALGQSVRALQPQWGPDLAANRLTFGGNAAQAGYVRKIAGAPPKNSTIRTWALIHEARSCAAQASAYT